MENINLVIYLVCVFFIIPAENNWGHDLADISNGIVCFLRFSPSLNRRRYLVGNLIGGPIGSHKTASLPKRGGSQPDFVNSNSGSGDNGRKRE